jgi:hypothetical protein
MSTVKATNFQNASSATANMVTDASGNVSFGGTAAMSSSFLRNRIINGDMRIDQRNAGASVTVNSVTKAYCVDRFCGTGIGSAGVFTLQQTSTAPSIFVNSLKATVTTADASLAATDLYRVMHLVEGFNSADLGWGTANAQTVTFSFWVYSNLTGTFGGSFINSAANRSYPFSYTISVANTWEQKAVTIAGDTSGTWLTTNGIGVSINFGLGVGSTYSGTANAWAGSEYYSATGATNVMATLSNTFYITGVQLEVGTVATPFERQLYNAQLAQCQRYYWRFYPGAARRFGSAFNNSTTVAVGLIIFPVPMRTSVSALEQSGTATDYGVAHAAAGTVASAVPVYSIGSESSLVANLTVASGLTTGSGSALYAINANAYLGFSAEL